MKLTESKLKKIVRKELLRETIYSNKNLNSKNSINVQLPMPFFIFARNHNEDAFNDIQELFYELLGVQITYEVLPNDEDGAQKAVFFTRDTKTKEAAIELSKRLDSPASIGPYGQTE
jgi:hypothetical protein